MMFMIFNAADVVMPAALEAVTVFWFNFSCSILVVITFSRTSFTVLLAKTLATFFAVPFEVA